MEFLYIVCPLYIYIYLDKLWCVCVCVCGTDYKVEFFAICFGALTNITLFASIPYHPLRHCDTEVC